MRGRYSLTLGALLSACASDPSPATDPQTPGAIQAEAAGKRAPNAGAAGIATAASARVGAGNAAASGTAGVPVSGAGGKSAATASAGKSAAGDAAASAAGTTASSAGTNAAGSGSPRAGSSAAGSNAPTATAGTAASAGKGGAGASGAAAHPTPLYRVPLRVHIQQSKLSDAELTPIFTELNDIWQRQAGICFDIEVVANETNRTDGFDFRYTAGRIPGASSANGLTQNAHEIWSIDHPQLNAAPHAVMYPTARTTAHELGHALGLAHENPPPSTDCSEPCHCVERGDNCDDYLLRSGTKGFFLSPPEIEITRQRAARAGKADAADSCAAPVFMR